MYASRMLRMAVTKTSTGLVGLKVNPHARQDLIKMYRRTLEEVKVRQLSKRTDPQRRVASCRTRFYVQILPPEAVNYRTAVEQITKYRLHVVETNEEVRDERQNAALIAAVDAISRGTMARATHP